MNRSRILFFLLSLLLVLPIVTGSLTARDQAVEDDSLYKHLAVFTEVLGLVNQAYVEPADEAALLAGALDGATDALDPFSVYVPAHDVEAYREARDVGLRRTGLVLLRERSVVYVVGVVAKSPADTAGVKVGDVITEIRGESTRQTPVWKIESLLAARPGTEVPMKILRAGEAVEVQLKLSAFTPPAPELTEVEGVEVLRLYTFGPETLAAVEKALGRIEQGPGDRLLLDLRGVSGGDVETAYKVAGLFAQGRLGTLSRRGQSIEDYKGAEPRWQGKLVVLIDRGTLGAAEVLATVLRQKLEVDLVGERSFGYAGRLREIELSSGGRLWITDAFYTGPDGVPLNRSLDPDVQVSSLAPGLDEVEDGEATEGEAPKADAEEKDPVLERGIELLLEETPSPEAEKIAA